MTAVDGQLTKPLRSGRSMAIVGLAAVLAAEAFGGTSRMTWLLGLLGVIAATSGAVRTTRWSARLHERRSLTEIAVGLFLVGTADAMTVTAAAGPQDRENTAILIISAIGFALLGTALLGSGVADFRRERRWIEDPASAPAPDPTSRPQPPGTRVTAWETGFLRVTLGVSALTLVAAPVLALLH